LHFQIIPSILGDMRQTFTRRALIPLLLVAAAGTAAGETNLVRNGSFRTWDTPAAAPAGWRIVDTGHKVSGDAAEGALRVDIGRAAENDGQIVQRVKVLQPGRAYVLAGQIRGTKSGIAHLQVKLHRGGREQRRVTAEPRCGPDWTVVEAAFSGDDADEIEILCRFRQRADTLGQTVWFRDVQLAEAGPPSIAGGQAVPTFECAGLCVDVRGGVSGTAACAVRHRATGAQEWIEGMNLEPCAADRQFRGSIFGLRPDTAYQIECRLIDTSAAAKPASSVLRLETRTWREDVPVAEIRPLPSPGPDGGILIDAKGRPDGWIAYRPAPGAAPVDAGTNTDHAVRIEGAAYVVVEGFTIRGGRRDAVRIAKSDSIRVRRCDVAGWGDPGTRKAGLSDGLYVDARGRVINFQAGIRVCDGSTRIVVEDCFLHAPRGTANSWEFGHPAGPQGIILDRTGGNHVLRRNDIVGCEARWWNDAIESIANGEVSGGPYRDTDIHGNVLAFSNDDGTELDGGQINVRYWHNWIDRALCGVSCAPNRAGPSYVFRNLIAGLGEERGKTGSAFKMGGASQSPGMNVIVHNTIHGPGGGLRSVGFGNDRNRGAYVARSRNNVFAGDGGGDVTNVSTDPRNDFDHDLTARGGVKLAGGGERHAVTSAPVFVAAAQGDLRLAPGSPGLDAGVRLPGLNDAFAGAAPDMGALESGLDGPDFPPRPHGLSVQPLRTVLAPPAKGGRVEGELRVVLPAAAGASWSAHPNSPWLTCTPDRGAADGKPATVRVSIADDGRDRPRYRGAVTFRTDGGLLRTVMVEAGTTAGGP